MQTVKVKSGKKHGMRESYYYIKTLEISGKKLSLNKIKGEISKFLQFAKKNQHILFKVVVFPERTPKQVAGMFRKRSNNVLLPREFRKYCRSLEERFLRAWNKKYPNLPKPKQQWMFHSDRNFRFDFAWPKYKLAVEIQGGSFMFGGHNRGVMQSKDYDKFRWAARKGWRLLPFNTLDIGKVDDGKIFDCVQFVAETLCDAREIK